MGTGSEHATDSCGFELGIDAAQVAPRTFKHSVTFSLYSECIRRGKEEEANSTVPEHKEQLVALRFASVKELWSSFCRDATKKYIEVWTAELESDGTLLQAETTGSLL